MNGNPRSRQPLKESKVQLRLRPAQKEVIARAAEAKQTTLTSFMVQHALVPPSRSSLIKRTSALARSDGRRFVRRSTRRPRKFRPYASGLWKRACSMATEEPLGGPVPLERDHDLSHFDCGVEPLNDYLKKYAYLNHQNRSSRTYVATRGMRVVGYYTLAAGSVSREETPPRVAQGLGDIPYRLSYLRGSGWT